MSKDVKPARVAMVREGQAVAEEKARARGRNLSTLREVITSLVAQRDERRKGPKK